MTIKVTISHDEPNNRHGIYVGVLRDLAGHDVPQMKDTIFVEPGKATTVMVYSGQEIQVWEAPLPIELRVADAIEAAMRDGPELPNKADRHKRLKIARAAIAAASTNSGP